MEGIKKHLEKDIGICAAHEKSAQEGQTEVGWRETKAGHETREFKSCPKNSSLGYQNGLLDTRK